jgi:type I restriction enzyme S subunit
MNKYPATWGLEKLGNLTKKIGSGATPKGGETAYKISGVPLVRSMNVVFFGFKRTGLAFIDQDQAKALDSAVIEAGDILLNITGASIGRVTRAPADLGGARVNQHVCIVRPLQGLDARFLNAYISAPAMQSQIWADNYGVTRQALTKQQIVEFDIPVPPLAEQTRIADKLDTVLTRVDACRDRLARVASLLKRLRQSVLAAATSGLLTEDWRAAGGSGWRKIRLGELGELGRGKSKHRPRNDAKLYGGAYPFIQTGDVTNSNGCIERHSQTYSEFGLLQSKLWPADTLCITIAANIADTAVLSYPACFPDSVVGFVPNQSLCKVKYIKWSIDVLKDDIERLAPATAQKNINLGILDDVQINLPSVQEQTEIVRRVETLFAFADRLEARLKTAQAAADRLTPALLAKAFRGELVPQDPNDEPAAELLQRLAASRDAAPKAKRGRRSATADTTP